MSIANACDRCGNLYKPSAGSVHIERLGIASESAPDVFDTWDEIDLCPTCGKSVIDAIGEAINREHHAEIDSDKGWPQG